MSNGLLAFAAGLGSGYLTAQQRDYERARQASLDAQNKELHDANMDQLNLAKKQRLGLADAAAPAVVNDQAASLGLADGTRTTYDMPNAADVAGSDFRQLRSADQATGNRTLARSNVQVPPSSVGLGDRVQNPVDPQPSPEGQQAPVNMSTTPTSVGLRDSVNMPTPPAQTFAVKGLGYDSQIIAKKAADAYNTPKAQIARQAQVYRDTGSPEKALALEAGASSQQATDMALADKAWSQKIGQAMMAGGDTSHDGLAALISNSEVGPMAGKTVKAVASPDGKMVTYNTVSPDGTLTPTSLTFSNDKNGVIQAGYLLDKAIAPEHRYASYMADRKAEAQTSFENRKQNEVERHNVETENEAKKKAQMEFDPLGLNTSSSGTGGNGTGTTAQAIASGVKGPELLKALPGPLADQIKALADGRLAFPAGFALKTPYWQSMLSLTAQYDPTFDSVNYGARAATRKDFTSGRSAQSSNALNTVLGHLESLSTAADALDNTRFPLLNSIGNSAAASMGDPRIKKFDATKKAVVDELTRAWRGSGGSEGDIKTWSGTLDAANSPQQLHGVIGQLGELLESKISALNDLYAKGMGTTENGLQLMSPHAAEVLQKIRQRAGIDTGSQQPTLPSTGSTPAGVQPEGSWKPGQKQNAPAAVPLSNIESEMRRRGLIK